MCQRGKILGTSSVVFFLSYPVVLFAPLGRSTVVTSILTVVGHVHTTNTACVSAAVESEIRISCSRYKILLKFTSAGHVWCVWEARADLPRRACACYLRDISCFQILRFTRVPERGVREETWRQGYTAVVVANAGNGRCIVCAGRNSKNGPMFRALLKNVLFCMECDCLCLSLSRRT